MALAGAGRLNTAPGVDAGALLHCGRFVLDLSRPRIMGIVNLTPDSFSGDGFGCDVSAALAHAHAQIAAGADILDIGAESTRPGAASVTEEDELARLMPVLQNLRDCPLPISVDTSKPAVMRAALAAGAAMINDVAALTAPGALEVIANANCAVCLMHMRGNPQVMQDHPQYADVVTEVRDWLLMRAAACRTAGIAATRIAIDPGFGFGKTQAHNFALLRNLDSFAASGYAVLAGLSRKSMFNGLPALGERAPAERVFASVAAALIAAQRGAALVRVHDVAATRAALAVWAEVS